MLPPSAGHSPSHFSEAVALGSRVFQQWPAQHESSIGPSALPRHRVSAARVPVGGPVIMVWAESSSSPEERSRRRCWCRSWPSSHGSSPYPLSATRLGYRARLCTTVSGTSPTVSPRGDWSSSTASTASSSSSADASVLLLLLLWLCGVRGKSPPSRPSAAPSADRCTLHFSKGQEEGLCPGTPRVFLQQSGDPVFRSLPFVRRWQKRFGRVGSRESKSVGNRLLGVRGVMNPDLGLNRHPTSPPPALWDL